MSQSFIITGGTEGDKQKEAGNLWKQLFPNEEWPVFDLLQLRGNPIKIAQIREASRFLTIKPVVTSAKIIEIFEAEKMNGAAANAFLKTLEEPQGQSLIFLLTDKPYDLPETVLSRCQIVRIKSEIQSAQNAQDKEGEDLARVLAKGGLGERLAILAQERRGREEFGEFVKRQVRVWRRLLLTHQSDTEMKRKWFRRGVEVFLKAEKMLAANVNMKLVEGYIGLFLPGKMFDNKEKTRS